MENQVMDTDDAGELSSLALHMGFVMGSLCRSQTIAAMKERGATTEEIGDAREALAALADAFYRKDVD